MAAPQTLMHLPPAGDTLHHPNPSERTSPARGLGALVQCDVVEGDVGNHLVLQATSDTGGWLYLTTKTGALRVQDDKIATDEWIVDLPIVYVE